MKSRLLSAAIVVIASFVLAACGSEESEESASTTPTTEETSGGGAENAVKIGLLTGLTGDYAPWGERYVAATEVAAEEVNAAGGILGRPLEIVVADSESTLEGAVARWPRLAEVEKVSAVVGVESDGGVALIESAAEAKIPVICSVCGTPTLDTRGGDFVWRMIGGDTQIGVALAQIALDKTKDASVLTQQGLEITEGISDIFAAAFEKGGGTIVDRVKFDGDAGTFQAELEQVFDGSKNVFLASGLEPATRIFNEWQRRNYGGMFFGPPDWVANDVADTLEGHSVGVGHAFPLDSPAYKTFAAGFRDRLGEDPSPAYNEPPFYDQILLIGLAATAAGDTSGQAIRDHLAEVANAPGKVVYSYADGVKELEAGNDIDFRGSTGSVEFDETGSVTGLYAEVVPEGGEWKQSKSFQLDTSLTP